MKKMLLLKLSLLGVMCSLHADENPLPVGMASLGDSITAAAIAKFPRQWGIYPWVQSELTGKILYAYSTKDLSSVESRDMSWAAGLGNKKVLSHAGVLKKLNPNLLVFNQAISGSMAHDVVERQIGPLNDWSKKNLGQEYPDYVALLIGPNDLCTDEISNIKVTDPQKYREKVSFALNEMLSRSPKTKILVSSIPKIHTLQAVGKGQRVTTHPEFSKCEDVWEKTKFCLNAQFGDAKLLAELGQKVAEYNLILRQLTQENKNKFGDRIRYAPEISEYDFNANELAVDCFHPNFYAQNTISKKTFQNTWWANDWNKYSKGVQKK